MNRRSNGEGTAAMLRKDGRWSRSIWIGGKRKFLYGKNRAEVDKKYKELSIQLASNTYFENKKKTRLCLQTRDTLK